MLFCIMSGRNVVLEKEKFQLFSGEHLKENLEACDVVLSGFLLYWTTEKVPPDAVGVEGSIPQLFSSLLTFGAGEWRTRYLGM